MGKCTRQPLEWFFHCQISRYVCSGHEVKSGFILEASISFPYVLFLQLYYKGILNEGCKCYVQMPTEL